MTSRWIGAALALLLAAPAGAQTGRWVGDGTSGTVDVQLAVRLKQICTGEDCDAFGCTRQVCTGRWRHVVLNECWGDGARPYPRRCYLGAWRCRGRSCPRPTKPLQAASPDDVTIFGTAVGRDGYCYLRMDGAIAGTPVSGYLDCPYPKSPDDRLDLALSLTRTR